MEFAPLVLGPFALFNICGQIIELNVTAAINIDVLRIVLKLLELGDIG